MIRLSKREIESAKKEFPYQKWTGYSPLAGSNAKIAFYVRLLKEDLRTGNINVVLEGKIVSGKDETRAEHLFRGALIYEPGTGGFNVAEGREEKKVKSTQNLQESLEAANTEAGNPIKDVYTFIKTVIIPRIPFEYGSKETDGKKKKGDTKFQKGNQVQINLPVLKGESTELFNELLRVYPDINNTPYGIVFDTSGGKATVIFKNQKYMILPERYLIPRKIYESEQDDNWDLSMQHYEEEKKNFNNPKEFKQALDSMGDSLLTELFKIKQNKKQPFDKIDQQVMKAYKITLPQGE